MSILDYQADRLRKYAERLRQLANGHVNQGFPARQDLYESAAEMREAADTIESLRDRLQEIQGVTGESRCTALFGTPERAAQTMAVQCFGATSEACDTCVFGECDGKLRNSGAYPTVYDALLEWLRGDA